MAPSKAKEKDTTLLTWENLDKKVCNTSWLGTGKGQEIQESLGPWISWN